YCTREHDSLKISNGKWMWWSRGFGGNSALDYLIKVKGMQFMDAMKILTKEGTDLHDTDAKISRKPDCDVKRKLLLPDKSETNFEVIRYLTSRGIDSDVIKACIDEGLLYESLPYHNCIFVGFDETGNAAYAFYRATTGERLMGEAAGSDKRYSFRIDRAGSTLHVFESAIDLLSYATIMKMRTDEWRAEPMLSLGGVYAPSTNNKQTKLPIALQNMTQNQTQINTIALHLDNDFAGRSATRSISEQLGNKYIVRDEPPAYGKDCNDYLQQLQRQKRKRQMER
ncbi:MAG TPA: topoisomerase, partial [Lachnospiraceae bacterium]|nr:topoisomerase [Lachnospiraceae bacterium]